MASTYENVDRFERLSRYLSGQLNDAEAARFEGDWASNPHWTSEMELDARLQSGLGELRRTGQIEAAMRGRWWVLPLRMLTMAAGVAALGFALWTWQFGGRSAAALLARAPTLALGESVAIMRLRQASAVDASVELPAQPSSIELRVLPDASDAPAGQTYGLSLARIDASAARAQTWVDNFVSGADGFVRAYLDSSAVSPGRYRLLVRRTGSRETDQFLLDVRSLTPSQSGN